MDAPGDPGPSLNERAGSVAADLIGRHVLPVLVPPAARPTARAAPLGSVRVQQKFTCEGATFSTSLGRPTCSFLPSIETRHTSREREPGAPRGRPSHLHLRIGEHPNEIDSR